MRQWKRRHRHLGQFSLQVFKQRCALLLVGAPHNLFSPAALIVALLIELSCPGSETLLQISAEESFGSSSVAPERDNCFPLVHQSESPVGQVRQILVCGRRHFKMVFLADATDAARSQKHRAHDFQPNSSAVTVYNDGVVFQHSARGDAFDVSGQKAGRKPF